MTKSYRALKGLRYPTNPNAPRDQWVYKSVQPGDVVSDIPAKSLPWLLKDGVVVEADSKPPERGTAQGRGE